MVAEYLDCQHSDIRVTEDNGPTPSGFKGIHLGRVRNCKNSSPREPRARGLFDMYQDSVAGSPREKNQSHLREPWEGRFVLDTKKFCLPLVKILNVPQRYTDFTKAILTLQNGSPDEFFK